MHIHRISQPRLSRISACERLPLVLSAAGYAGGAGGAKVLCADAAAGHSGTLDGWRRVGDITASPAKKQKVGCRVLRVEWQRLRY